MKNIVIEFPKKQGVTVYCPEMGQKKPLADIEAKISYAGKWRIKSKLELKGRGIKFHDHDDNGLKIYYATERAFEKLENQYSISMESLLD